MSARSRGPLYSSVPSVCECATDCVNLRYTGEGHCSRDYTAADFNWHKVLHKCPSTVHGESMCACSCVCRPLQCRLTNINVIASCARICGKYVCVCACLPYCVCVILIVLSLHLAKALTRMSNNVTPVRTLITIRPVACHTVLHEGG